MKNDRFVTIRCIFVPVGWDAASPGNEKIRLPNDRTYAGAAAQPLVCLSFSDTFFFCPGTPEPLPVSRHPSVPSGSLFRKPPGPAPPIGCKRLLSGLRIVPSACTAALFGPGTPNRLRYPGARLLRPVRFFECLPALRPRSTASAFFRPANRAFRLHRRHLWPRHPRTAFGIPAPVCSVRNRTDAKGSDPPGRSAAASGGPAGRPTPAGRGTAIPPRRSQTGRFPSTAASASRRTTPGNGTDGAYRCV